MERKVFREDYKRNGTQSPVYEKNQKTSNEIDTHGSLMRT